MQGDSTVSRVLQGGGVAIVVLVALRALARRWKAGRNPGNLPYPPGPKGLPVIGNLLDIPSEKPYEEYLRLSKQYGDIMFLSVLGQHIMVLSSERRIKDLFERRSNIYSGRPHSVVMHDMLEFDNFFAIANYGPSWRQHRRAFHQHFYSGAIPQYLPIIKTYTQRYLVSLSAPNPNFDEIAREAIAGLGIEIIYGFEFSAAGGTFIQDVIAVGEAFEAAGVPGRFLAELMPFLQYVPPWMPGAGFRRWAIEHREASRRVLNKPFQEVYRAHAKNEAKKCMATSLIDRLPPSDTAEREQASTVARNVSAMTHLAAVDTTHSAAMAFFLAMAVYPEVQRTAQEELDRVVGHGVIPDISQKPELPYMDALLSELLRWIQVLPIALPHFVTEDHVYDGYFIPKGTVVFGNAWGILHDPDVFENPMEFKPERFLKDGKFDSGVLDPMVATFGFGRRKCPGRLLAVETLYSIVSSTLAIYNILPPKDENGNPIKMEARFKGGAMMRPEAFGCVFEHRSSAARGVLQDLKTSNN